MAPNGRSFITAVALQNTSLWIHDTRGERQISLEANAAEPIVTPDRKKVLFRIVREAPYEFAWYRDAGELRVADLESGRSEPFVPRLQALSYDLSLDGRQVVMEIADADGRSRLWLAPLDRTAPPRQIPGAVGNQPKFGPDGEIFFRHLEESSRAEGTLGFLYRIRADGTQMRKALDQPVLLFWAVSPDGNWVSAWAPVSVNGPASTQVFPLGGGTPVPIESGGALTWSRDGRSVYMSEGATAESETYVIPLKPGQIIPRIPAGGVHSDEGLARLPGARKIVAGGVRAGPTADVYTFYRSNTQRNLYRIPIP